METQQIYATNTVRFTYPGKKNNFPSESKFDTRKLWYLCGDFCDMQSTVCWPIAVS